MPSLPRCGHPYRVSGADQVTGKDVEITIEAYDEADACRAANRQGIFVSGCVAAQTVVTFRQAVAHDPVAQKLAQRFPNLGHRLRRLNHEDQDYLSHLVRDLSGVSHRDSAHMARLIRDNRHLPST